MTKKKTGVYNASGKDAHTHNTQNARHNIDAIFDRTEAEFHAIAVREGLSIAQGMVPIDTHTLQKNIQAFRQGNATIIEVPDATLFYPKPPLQRNALAIALALEEGAGLRRRKSNRLPGTRKDQPTQDWFALAGQRMQQEIQPIADQLLKSAITEALNAIYEPL
jgi:hypothetical protein